jgi:RNA polymerase sigma-70 factor, ECF subfamily
MNWEELPADKLLRACASAHNSDAWEEFVRRFHAVIAAAATRVSQGCGAFEEVDDVVQEIYFKFCSDKARILDSAREMHSNAVFGFVKVVATNTARDFFRSRGALKRGVRRMAVLDEDSEDLALPENIERYVTLEQISEILLTITEGERAPRDRAIFYLYYRDGMSAQAISELPGIDLNAKGVEGVLYRLTGTLRRTVSGAQENGRGSRTREGEDVET